MNFFEGCMTVALMFACPRFLLSSGFRSSLSFPDKKTLDTGEIKCYKL
jgi:hypothetical protein